MQCHYQQAEWMQCNHQAQDGCSVLIKLQDGCSASIELHDRCSAKINLIRSYHCLVAQGRQGKLPAPAVLQPRSRSRAVYALLLG